MEIPVKEKYLANKKLYGYPRNHSGNGRKKAKKLGSGGTSAYDKRSHVLVLQANGKIRFYHGQEARNLLGP